MSTARILILAIVSILEIDSSTIPMNHQTLLWSPFLRYPASPAILPDESSHVPQFQNSAEKLTRKIKPTDEHRYRRKKNRLLNPIAYKKLRSPKGPKYSRNLKKNYPLENWKYQIEDTKNSEHLDEPSAYLKPPRTTNEDHHYYEGSKKKSLKDRPEEPHHNWTFGIPKNHKLEDENEEDEKYEKDRPVYTKDHAPEQQVEATYDKETSDSEERSNDNSMDAPVASKGRIEFHIHGHAGPETYMFGYDTGDGDNRQYRMEERHENGTVTGHYGYIDPLGKLRKVRYKASPTHGYEEKHHESSGQEA